MKDLFVSLQNLPSQREEAGIVLAPAFKMRGEAGFPAAGEDPFHPVGAVEEADGERDFSFLSRIRGGDAAALPVRRGHEVDELRLELGRDDRAFRPVSRPAGTAY